MSKTLILQVCASVGALLGIALVYVGLSQNLDTLVMLAFVLFAVSLLVTPALRLVPKWARDGVADQS